MLVPFARVMRNPTIKDEIRDKQLGENYSFGFPLYSVGQVAHLEMTREVARRFNQLYCGVDSHATDGENLVLGGAD